MMIHDITALAGPYKKRRRVGRGHGSGWGKQSGRGHKGAGSRRGYSKHFADEGGQMPYFRRMPKLGFTNAQFKTHFWTVNLVDIVEHEAFQSGGEVTAESLIAAGLVRDTSRDVKVLGDLGRDGDGNPGTLSVKLTVNVGRVSTKARAAIEAAGGTVHESGTRRDRVRGIDRNSDDKTPKNLTKKLRRPGFGKGGKKS